MLMMMMIMMMMMMMIMLMMLMMMMMMTMTGDASPPPPHPPNLPKEISVQTNKTCPTKHLPFEKPRLAACLDNANFPLDGS